MTLSDITVAAQDFTDERNSETMVIKYVNEGIGKINTKIGISLPPINTTGDYDGFMNESWVRALLVPYAGYGIKMNDGSIEEAMIYLDSFEMSLRNLQRNLQRAVHKDFLGNKATKIVSIPSKQRW